MTLGEDAQDTNINMAGIMYPIASCYENLRHTSGKMLGPSFLLGLLYPPLNNRKIWQFLRFFPILILCQFLSAIWWDQTTAQVRGSAFSLNPMDPPPHTTAPPHTGNACYHVHLSLSLSLSLSLYYYYYYFLPFFFRFYIIMYYI